MAYAAAGKAKSNMSALNYVLIVGGVLLLGVVSGFFGGAYGRMDNLVRPMFTPPHAVFYVLQPLCCFLLGNALFFLLTADRCAAHTAAYRIAAVSALLAALALLIAVPYLLTYLKAYSAGFILLSAAAALLAGLTVIAFKINKAAALFVLPALAWLAFCLAFLIAIAMYN
ncbi:MAG: tryptophan-rich sensory protein [Clostridiales bacterium]|jgi:tryptophan-rich sensory protein|nr:tryptophan-rich sensory protein [Clostridiales bacterium]